MDSDFWTSHFAAAKRQSNLHNHHQHLHHGLYQSHQLDSPNVDDYVMEEEVRPDFPCPYCYEDFDIASLCSHLKDEHSSESKATICPICSVNSCKRYVDSYTHQHGHLFKLQRRRRLHRDAYPGGHALSLLGRDLREARIQMKFRETLASTTEDASAKSSDSPQMWKLRFDPSMSCEERAKRMKQAALRAVFVQDLFASTLSIS